MIATCFKPYTIVENGNFPKITVIKIRSADYAGVSYLNNKFTYLFIGCRFNKLIIENEDLIDFENISVHFFNCFIEDLEIKNISSNNIRLGFNNSLIRGIIENANILHIDVTNCLLHNSFYISKVKTVNISYYDDRHNMLDWKVMLSSLNNNFNYVFHHTNSFYLYDCSTIIFEMNESSSDKIGVYRDKFFDGNERKVSYKLNEQQKKQFKVALRIQYSALEKHDATKIIGARLTSLELNGFCTGQLDIENSKIDNIFLSELTCEKWAVLYNIRPFRMDADEKKLQIQRCNLEKFTFDNFSFDDYSTISLYRNRFEKTLMISCNFPEEIEGFEKFKILGNIHYPDRRDDNYYKARYETFLRLKKIIEDSGNVYEAQKFQAVSNEALKKIENLPQSDKFILDINNISNNHGLSISQPFLLILFFSAFFYILYLWSLRHIFTCDEVNFNLIGYYFAFLDITHRADFMVNKDELNGLSYTIDYLNKIVSGFLIYQFIAAFRKYGKK
jgi:hypothetical protein